MLFAYWGFDVITVTGKLEQTDFLKGLGANKVIDRDDMTFQVSKINQANTSTSAWSGVENRMVFLRLNKSV